MSPRGGSCPLRTLRAFHEGILRHLSAAARTESLHRLMSTIASRGSAITLGMLGIRALALNGPSWTFRFAKIISRLSPHKGSPLRADPFWSGSSKPMGKHFLSQAWIAFGPRLLKGLYHT